MLEPIFEVSEMRQKPSDARSKFTTLREPLPKRIQGPLVLTLSYVDDNGIKHENRQTIKPINHSYNLESKESILNNKENQKDHSNNLEKLRSRSSLAKAMWGTDEIDWPDGKPGIKKLGDN